MENVESWYFEETASLLDGVLAILEREDAEGKNRQLFAVANIIGIVKDRLTSPKLNGIVETLEKNQQTN